MNKQPRGKEPKKRAVCPPTDPPGVLIAYTDGSTFRQNPGPISWSVVFVRDGRPELRDETPWELVGASEAGSAPRAELMAIIWALEHTRHEDVVIRTDSLYVKRGCTGEARNRANLDLWCWFRELMQERHSRGLGTWFEHIRGHAGHVYNVRADYLARNHAERNYAGVTTM